MNRKRPEGNIKYIFFKKVKHWCTEFIAVLMQEGPECPPMYYHAGYGHERMLMAASIAFRLQAALTRISNRTFRHSLICSKRADPLSNSGPLQPTQGLLREGRSTAIHKNSLRAY